MSNNNFKKLHTQIIKMRKNAYLQRAKQMILYKKEEKIYKVSLGECIRTWLVIFYGQVHMIS